MTSSVTSNKLLPHETTVSSAEGPNISQKTPCSRRSQSKCITFLVCPSNDPSRECADVQNV